MPAARRRSGDTTRAPASIAKSVNPASSPTNPSSDQAFVGARKGRRSAVVELLRSSVHRKTEGLIQRGRAVGRARIGVARAEAVAENAGRCGFESARLSGPQRLIERRPRNVIRAGIGTGGQYVLPVSVEIETANSDGPSNFRNVVQRSRQAVRLAAASRPYSARPQRSRRRCTQSSRCPRQTAVRTAAGSTDVTGGSDAPPPPQAATRGISANAIRRAERSCHNFTW